MTTSLTQDTSTTITEMDIPNLVDDLLMLLSKREKDIILKRYALDEDEQKYTLAQIGKKYSITRERVRQMEVTALEKLRRTAERTKLNIINEFAYSTIKKHGFIISETEMISLVLSVLKNSKDINKNNIKLAVNLERRLIKLNNTIQYKPYWRTNDIKESEIKGISAHTAKALKNSKDKHLEIDEMVNLLKKEFPKFNANTFKAVFTIDKNLKLRESLVGLASDSSINPKTLRAKIIFVLQKHNKPMHFVEIANMVIKEKFDKKQINIQAVHNDLIRHNGFVLIGRGIYALKEWGYKEGTVKDVILDILKDGKAKSRIDIIKEVKKQRIVKDVTISLNLKSPQIKRVGRDQYALVK